MKKARPSEVLRYRFDNLMSRGTGALLLALASVTAFMILIVSFIVWITNANPDIKTFPDLVWVGLMHSLDSGTISGDNGNRLYLLLMFIITLCGIFILSILIGILTTGIESKLDALRKGRSQVLEKDQTIILGWSEQIFPILQELIEANANNKRACVVIMGNMDKSEMDSAIRERIANARTTKIVTRQGNPIDIDDLEIVSLNTSRSIIILPEDDISVVKTILAITNNPNKRSEPYHIVTVLQDPKYLEVARIAGNDQVEIILSDTFVSRIIAQTCRQPGLSFVYNELLDFGGDEIYFSDCPQVIGKRFADTLNLFEKSSVIGICSGGITSLNPPMDTALKPGDKIIAISEDDDTIITGASVPHIDESLISRPAGNMQSEPEKTLILGWNGNARKIVEEMDHYVAPSSLVTIVSENISEDEFTDNMEGITHQKVEVLREDPKNRAVLDSLIRQYYSHVIILCDGDGGDIQEVDANTLVVLLHLRDISEKMDCRFSVVSEMLDFRNKKLAEATKVNDFIVSEKLVSLMLTQVAENKQLNAVLQDLFDADGSEVYLKPAANYVLTGKSMSYGTAVEAAKRKGEVAIGYVLSSEQTNEAKNYGIYVNPGKASTVTFTKEDSIIVIAEG